MEISIPSSVSSRNESIAPRQRGSVNGESMMGNHFVGRKSSIEKEAELGPPILGSHKFQPKLNLIDSLHANNLQCGLACESAQT